MGENSFLTLEKKKLLLSAKICIALCNNHRYKEHCGAIMNFEFRADDVVQMSFPKSGSVWTREILWTMTNLHQLHLAQQVHINDRVYAIHEVRSSYRRQFQPLSSE